MTITVQFPTCLGQQEQGSGNGINKVFISRWGLNRKTRGFRRPEQHGLACSGKKMADWLADRQAG